MRLWLIPEAHSPLTQKSEFPILGLLKKGTQKEGGGWNSECGSRIEELRDESGLINSKPLTDLIKESDELVAIFVTIGKKSKEQFRFQHSEFQLVLEGSPVINNIKGEGRCGH